MKEQDLIDLGFVKHKMDYEHCGTWHYYHYELSWNLDLVSSNSDEIVDGWSVSLDMTNTCDCWETPREILDDLNDDIKYKQDIIITEINDLKTFIHLFKKYAPEQ